MNLNKCKNYDKQFLLDNMMGPNSMMLLEEISNKLKFHPEMRVLDLGCGKALTSIFLAKEFGVDVVATDLWVEATENYQRFKDFGLDKKIFPIHCDVHQMPFANEYFDAVVSVDSYHYYGNKPGFIDEYIVPLVKKGGFIAVVVPGIQRETNGIPEILKPFWQDELNSFEFNFYTVEWWKNLWNESPNIEVIDAFELESHQEAWKDWLKCDNPYAKHDVDMMKAENGEYYNTVGIIAKVK